MIANKESSAANRTSNLNGFIFITFPLIVGVLIVKAFIFALCILYIFQSANLSAYRCKKNRRATDKWNDILAINLSSVFHTTRLALPGMRQRNWGRIINIASVHGLVASKEKSAYVAAKHAVVGLTKTVALETARSGITCNAICPGWVLTPLVQQQIDKRIAEGVDPEQASAQLLAEKQPSGEFVTPQQLGEMALFLCSDAAAQVRGAAWNMDGGWVAQ